MKKEQLLRWRGPELRGQRPCQAGEWVQSKPQAGAFPFPKCVSEVALQNCCRHQGAVHSSSSPSARELSMNHPWALGVAHVSWHVVLWCVLVGGMGWLLVVGCWRGLVVGWRLGLVVSVLLCVACQFVGSCL
jgi:hypothetical protein